MHGRNRNRSVLLPSLHIIHRLPTDITAAQTWYITKNKTCMIFTATVVKLACIRSDDALLVSQDGIVDHAGDGAHGRPEVGVVLQALHRDSPEL